MIALTFLIGKNWINAYKFIKQIGKSGSDARNYGFFYIIFAYVVVFIRNTKCYLTVGCDFLPKNQPYNSILFTKLQKKFY